MIKPVPEVSGNYYPRHSPPAKGHTRGGDARQGLPQESAMDGEVTATATMPNPGLSDPGSPQVQQGKAGPQTPLALM